MSMCEQGEQKVCTYLDGPNSDMNGSGGSGLVDGLGWVLPVLLLVLFEFKKGII